MTGNIAKKIGFSLLVWGLLIASSSVALAQKLSATTNVASGTANVVGGNWQVVKGVATLNGNDIKQGAQQAIQGAAQTGYGVAKGTQAILNADLPIVGSVTGKLGDKIAGGMIRDLGDDAAKWVAQQEGISAENLDKVKASTEGSGLFGNRAAIEYTVTNPDGTTSTVTMDANLKAIDGIMEGCMPIPVKLDQLKNCIFCPLFKILYDAARAMAVASFGTLSKAFTILLLLGFALYIAYLTLRQVSAFTKQDAPKYITTGLTMAFKVFFAWLLLANGMEIYRLGLEPILSAGIEMGSEFMQHQGNTGGASVSVTDCGGSVSGTTTTFYSDSLYSKVDCFLKKVTQEIAVSQSIGDSLMCVARHKASGWMGMWDLTMFVTGLIMWAMAWLICLAFAFYLIDTIIRLGVIGAILPFLIAAWPFELTKGYTATGWKMFLNAFFTFVFLGLVISVNVELSAQAATGGSGGTETIMGFINANDINGLMETMGIGLSGLLFMLVCCFFGFKLTGQAAQLASEMSGAKSPAIGSAIGALAAGATKGLTKRAGGVALGATKVAGEALPSVGAITSKVGDHGSLAGDFRAIGDSVAKIPGRINRAIYNNFTPAGRKLKNAKAGDEQNEEQNALPENEAQNALPDDQAQNGLPNNQAGNSNQNQANENNRADANDEARTGTEPSSGAAPTSRANSQQTGGAEEQSTSLAQDAGPRDEGDSTAEAMAEANNIVSQAKSEMASQAQNSANSVDTERSKEQEEARAHAAPSPQPSAPKKEPPAFGGRDGTPANQESAENQPSTTPAENVAPATREEVAQAKHDLSEGKQISPDTVASIVSAQNVVSKDIRDEMKRMVENAAANGVERKDIAAVSYVIAEMKGEHVAEKKNGSAVHEYRKGIDDETFRRAEEQLRAAQAKAAQAQAGQQPAGDNKGAQTGQPTGTSQTESESSDKPRGMVRGQYNDTIGRNNNNDDKKDNGKNGNQQELDAAKQEAMLLNNAIDGYRKRIEELQKMVASTGNTVAAAEIKRLKEEVERLEKSRK